MDWIFLLIAGFFEICFALTLRLSDGFTKVSPTVAFCIFSILSFWFLNKAIETIPLGIAYAVWTGIGAAGTVCIGMLFFGEHFSMWKLIFLMNLVGSIFCLKFIS